MSRPEIPSFAIDKFATAYNSTPYFRDKIVEFVPIVITVLRFIGECLGGATGVVRVRRENRLVRKIKRGGRFARNFAKGVVREQHPDAPVDQQYVFAENLVDEWSASSDSEIKQMINLSEQVVVN